MKNLLKITSLLSLTLFLISNTIEENNVVIDNGNSFDARINTYKYECKQLIKPMRYEGSRITYYTAQKTSITRSVESFLVLDTEYKFAFSGKECSSKVSVKLYDSADEQKRTLLKEIKNIQGKNVAVSTKDFMSVYRKKVSSTERLKMIYVEYVIAGGNSTKNEAIVMVVGYKD